jgi:hypothetical protein
MAGEHAKMERESRERLLSGWIAVWRKKVNAHARKASLCRIGHVLFTLPTILVPLSLTAAQIPEETGVAKSLLLLSALCGGLQTFLKPDVLRERYATASRAYCELVRDSEESLLNGADDVHDLNKRSEKIMREAPVVAVA